MKDNNTNDNSINDNEGNKQNNSDKEETNKNITLTDGELDMYLGYIPSGFANDNGNSYKEKKVTVNTVNKKYLLSIALGQTTELTDLCNLPNGLCNKEYYQEDFDNTGGWKMIEAKENVLNPILKTMYNLSLNDFNLKNESLDSEIKHGIAEIQGICFYYLDNEIYTWECSGGEKNITITDNYKIENDNLVIYSYAISQNVQSEEISIYDIYTGNNFIISSSNESNKEAINNYVINNQSKFTKYKSIFKKNDTGYYWYSTEVV